MLKGQLFPVMVDRRSCCFLIILLSFIPFQIGSVSANFMYLLLFLVCPIANLEKIPASTVLAIGIPVLSLIVGFFAGIGDGRDAFRSFVSFGAYISLFSILLLRVPLGPDDFFKALVLVCVAYSVVCLFYVSTESQFVFTDIRGIKSGLRDYLHHWPQRFPVLIVVALLYLIFQFNFGLSRLIAMALLFTCILFTYTRAIYVALFAGLVIGLLPTIADLNLKKLRSVSFFIFFAFGAAGLYLFFEGDLVIAIFDGVSLIASEAHDSIAAFLSGGVSVDRSGGSDSERLYHWIEALAIWSEHPIFGTGFAGIYQYSDMGSTHSQYIDVLLRSGVVGLAVYLYLWLLLFLRYWKRTEIVSGLVAIFVFGFLHESTKLTYTGLLFVLLLGFLKDARLQSAREPR